MLFKTAHENFIAGGNHVVGGRRNTIDQRVAAWRRAEQRQSEMLDVLPASFKNQLLKLSARPIVDREIFFSSAVLPHEGIVVTACRTTLWTAIAAAVDLKPRSRINTNRVTSGQGRRTYADWCRASRNVI